MIRLMTEHPSTVGESYLEHLAFATRFGASMILGGLACCLHGVLPFLEGADAGDQRRSSAPPAAAAPSWNCTDASAPAAFLTPPPSTPRPCRPQRPSM